MLEITYRAVFSLNLIFCLFIKQSLHRLNLCTFVLSVRFLASEKSGTNQPTIDARKELHAKANGYVS